MREAGPGLQRPELRAQALYRQGEILRSQLGDLSAANDAYLQELGPRSHLRPHLAAAGSYYWSEGDLANLTQIGAELVVARGAEARGTGWG